MFRAPRLLLLAFVLISNVSVARRLVPNWQGHGAPKVHVADAICKLTGGYNVTQIRHAYGLDQIAGTGNGQTIAIVVADGNPNIQTELNAFSEAMKLPSAIVNVVHIQSPVTLGTTNVNNQCTLVDCPVAADPPSAAAGWAVETSLDVEWAHAAAPNAKLLLVVAPNSTLQWLSEAMAFAATSGAQIVSMSYGGSEYGTYGNFIEDTLPHAPFREASSMWLPRATRERG